MSRRRPLAGFIIRLLVIYGLFCIPWPGLREGYGVIYRAAANALFGSFGRDGVVQFRPLEPNRGRFDTEIVVGRRGVPGKGVIPNESLTTGYLPLAETVALILAAPIPWRRRLNAMLFGALLVNGFVVLRRWLSLLHLFSLDQPWGLYKPGPLWQKVLTVAYEFISVGPTCTFLVPVFIWILVTFRREDFRRFFASTDKKTPAKTAPAL